MNIADLLTFGALAQGIFGMDVGTLKVEFHVMPQHHTGILLSKLKGNPLTDEMMEIVTDVVYITKFSNSNGKKYIWVIPKHLTF